MIDDVIKIRVKGFTEYVIVDKYDNDTVWMSIKTQNGDGHVVLSKKQAQDLIAALTATVEKL
jgi:hypothetical protein